MIDKRIRFLVSAVLITTFLAACATAPAAGNRGAAPVQQSGRELSGPAAAPAAAPPIAPAATSVASADAMRGAPAAAEAKAGSANAPQGSSPLPFDRMIIRNVSLTLTVKDVEGGLASIRDLATGVGGFVAQSSSRYDGDYQTATLTIQVPSERFDSVVDQVRKLAVKVESETGSSQDVTEEYTDLDAQVRNLQATEASLQRLMDKATRMDEIIALQRELTNVRGEIERRQGRMKVLSRRSDMATLTISLRPEGMVKPPQPQPVWRPLETARKAWEASSQVLLGIADVMITLFVFFWWMIPLVFIAIYLWRSRRVRRGGSATS